MPADRRGRRGTRDGTNTRDLGVASPSSAADPRRIEQEFLKDNKIIDRLDEATVNLDSSTGRFVSEHSLSKIWSRTVMARFLEFLGYGDSPDLVSLAMEFLVKTISILVSIRWDEWGKFGELFFEYRAAVRHDRKDTHLPYTSEVLQDSEFLGKRWGILFFREQSVYLPLVISQGSNPIFPRNRPLPFILSKTEPIAQGGYGSVTREVIAAYQFMPSTEYEYNSQDPSKYEVQVARKWFQAKGDFRKEAKNLAKLNESLSDHKRIVKYLAMFTIGDEEDRWASKEFNILLPLADTDLKKFLYEPEYSPKCTTIAHMVEEASNLADAIRWLHAGLRISGKVLICCHMDLKLDNVLVYLRHTSSPVGWWKISDFGISSMTERQHETPDPRRPSASFLDVQEVRSPAESLARITGTIRASVQRPAGIYSAPEIEPGKKVGPLADVFSFGCMLFQVLVRGVGGIELLKDLDEKRGSMVDSTNDHFCQRTPRGIQLHSSISAWLEDSKSLGNGSFSDRTIVMNCKRLIEKALRINPKERPNAEKLHDDLVKITNGEAETYTFDRDSNLILPLPPAPQAPRLLSPQPAPIIQVSRSVSIDENDEGQQSFQPPLNNFRISPPANQDYNLSLLTQRAPILPQKLSTPPPERQDRITGPSSLAQTSVPNTISMGLVTNLNRDNYHAPTFDQYREDSEGLVNTSPPLPPSEMIFIPKERHNSGQTNVPEVQNHIDSRGEMIPYQVENVLMTLISSTRAKIAFISQKETVIYTLYSPYSKKTIIPPKDHVWEKGSLGGDFLVLSGHCKSTSRQIFRLYKLSIVNQQLMDDEIQPQRLPSFNKFAVSRDGKLLLGAPKKVWLCQSFSSQAQELDTKSTQTGHLQQVWFSTHGLLAFARFSLPGNHHRVRIWDVGEPSRITGSLDYHVPTSDNSAAAVKTSIHFPRSPACLLWLEHNKIYLMQNPKLRYPSLIRADPHVSSLQAMVVTPNEEAVVFIRSHRILFRVTSRISIARIENHNGFKTVGNLGHEEDLKYRLEKPDSCEVVIEEHTSTSEGVRVLIGHRNGDFEVKDMKLPT